MERPWLALMLAGMAEKRGWEMALDGQARQRAALVAPHQAGVADNVRGQNRRQFALLTGHGNYSAFYRRW